jgi:5-methylcytosine-specific restriction endonuclease McrA
MFQLILPFIRSKTAGRGGNSNRKKRIFGEKKFIPCIFCGCSLVCVKSECRGAYSGMLIHSLATIEHIIPISRGGPNVMENLTLSCEMCNNNRQSTPFDEWKKIAPFDKLVRLLIKSNKIIGRCMI